MTVLRENSSWLCRLIFFILSVFFIIVFLFEQKISEYIDNPVKFEKPTSLPSAESNILPLEKMGEHLVTFSRNHFEGVPRWVPSEDDECIDGFRLANTTILHCATNSSNSFYNSSLDGNIYCGGVPLLPNYCILPSRGRWETNNMSTSLPDNEIPHRLGLHNYLQQNNSLSRCQSEEEYLNGSYEGTMFDRVWTPRTCQSMPLWPFAWAEQSSSEITIVMMGDSHIRNLYTATVNGLRGIKSFVEGHPSSAVKASGVIRSYEWHLNVDDSATDHSSIYINTNSFDPVPFNPCDYQNVRKCIKIAFIWAPTFQDQLKHIHLVQEWSSNLLILSPGNTYEPTDVLSEEWRVRIDHLMDQNDSLNVGIVHFPYSNQPIEKRINAAKNWTSTPPHGNRMSFWTQDSLAASGDQGKNTFHYTCSLGKINVNNDLINAFDPCTDETDASQIRALITRHFDAFRDSS